jgi:hypothetical protein
MANTGNTQAVTKVLLYFCNTTDVAGILHALLFCLLVAVQVAVLLRDGMPDVIVTIPGDLAQLWLWSTMPTTLAPRCMQSVQHLVCYCAAHGSAMAASRMS